MASFLTIPQLMLNDALLKLVPFDLSTYALNAEDQNASGVSDRSVQRTSFSRLCRINRSTQRVLYPCGRGNVQVPLDTVAPVLDNAGRQRHQPDLSGTEKPGNRSLAISKRTDYTAEIPKFPRIEPL